MAHVCGGKLSTLVGEGQFHGVDMVGAAEHGLSCLVEVAACNKDDEEESPTRWQLLLFSNRGSDISKSALRGFLCRLLLRKASSTPLLLRLSNPNPQEALCHNWPHCYCSQSRLSRKTSSQIPPRRGALLCLGGGEGRRLVGSQLSSKLVAPLGKTSPVSRSASSRLGTAPGAQEPISYLQTISSL